MTNKEILEEVYRRLKETTNNGFEVHNFTSVTSFIEQEWQKADDEEVTKWEGSHQAHPYGHFSNSWYNKGKKTHE